jgi:hypothetical protein
LLLCLLLCTVEDITSYINQSGATTVRMETDDLEAILRSLLMSSKVEESVDSISNMPTYRVCAGEAVCHPF